jgi:hypothetical protein
MEVVHVRALPRTQQPSTAQSQPPARRVWPVSVRLNHARVGVDVVQDPLLEPEYESVLESYLHSSDRPRWSPQSLSLDDDGGDDDLVRKEDRIRQYGEDLVQQLGLWTADFTRGVTECQIYVVEHRNASDDTPGIHCLAWELVEAVTIPRHPKLRLRVTRVSDLPAPAFLAPPDHSPQSLSAAQADQAATFRVLLIVARDFSRRGSERDPEPDLAQWPLMGIQKRLRGRMILEVVRPGSCEMLEEHLKMRAGQGVRFNLVHFDLHGRVKEDE